MRKNVIPVAAEGYPFLALLIVSTLVFAMLKLGFLAILSLIALWGVGHFFRDPERVIPQAEGLAVSPADGKVMRVETVTDPDTNERVTHVRIFMNLLSVHVNRMPVAGHIEKVTYIPGAFFNASLDKASTDNERCVWDVRSQEGDAWRVIQIAGLVARRIVPYVQAGTDLERGERFGMIRFGSCVEVYVPDTYEVAVHDDDQVYAGETVIATKKAVNHD